jgi:hypothetical protein
MQAFHDRFDGIRYYRSRKVEVSMHKSIRLCMTIPGEHFKIDEWDRPVNGQTPSMIKWMHEFRRRRRLSEKGSNQQVISVSGPIAALSRCRG